MVSKLENFLFDRRNIVLAITLTFTAVMLFFALRLHMEAGFEKQMPIGHEYIDTFQKYRAQLFGANRLSIVVKAKRGDIWNKAALSRLSEVTQAVYFLPHVDRSGVQSLWTPNSFVSEITEDGFRAQPVIPGTVTVDTLTPEAIEKIKRTTNQGGFVGTLVSKDQTSAMITAELEDVDRDGKRLDYVAYNQILEDKIRKAFEDDHYEIQIIGFAKQVGEIAKGASSVLIFCAIALCLTALAVYWYCHSLRLTLLPIACSLTSLVWQFGTLNLLGFGLDPLAVLVPFLVFSIGVSHGVQQINFIVREIAKGKSTAQAARASFSGLLIPGTLALVTAFVSFITLLLIPIPMVREMAIISSIGVAYKIVTNLIMLPLVATYFNFTEDYSAKAMVRHEERSVWLRHLSHVAEPRNAVIVVLIALAVFAAAVYESRGRVVGTVQPGAPELRVDSRFNRDAVAIAGGYDLGLDWLTVIFEAPADSCGNVAIGKYQDDFVATIEHAPGVTAVKSFSEQLRLNNSGYNEGTPKMIAVPLDPVNYAGLATEISRDRGYVSSDCNMSAVHIYLADHKATTIRGIIDRVKEFRKTSKFPKVTVRLASGNAGVTAAINEEVEHSELPMMINVYLAIAVLVLIAYRDFRAVVACCVPLTFATFTGYWFMKHFEIGLTVATLPVMVLAVGVGVDYAFYIYNRLQSHLAAGESLVVALEGAILEVGMATIFTAITLAIGVATWAFSDLKFQADMGNLLAFMFMVNLVMAMTVLPALVVLMERIFPRRRPIRKSAFSH